ncbi:MAG: hypothetical protein LUC97_10875 [Clostridiales bacterium]|nr:hypothetical protein [Clostridiales bacterium]
MKNFTMADFAANFKTRSSTSEDYPDILELSEQIIRRRNNIVNADMNEAYKDFISYVETLNISVSEFLDLESVYNFGAAQGFTDGFINGYLAAEDIIKQKNIEKQND